MTQYHTLVTEPLQTLERMLAHIGLDTKQLTAEEVSFMVAAVNKEKADRRPVSANMKTSRGSSILREDTLQMLNEFFAPHNEVRRWRRGQR